MLRPQKMPFPVSQPTPLALSDTSVAAFLGCTERGPSWPQSVVSWQEFAHWFGPHIPNSCLAYAVDGFLRNGGQRCYIGRVFPANAHTAGLTFSSLRVEAIGPGAWGNRIAVRIKQTGSGRFRMTARYWRGEPPSDFLAPRPRVVADPEENYDHLSPDPHSPDFVLKRLERGQSRLILVRWADERRRRMPRPRDFSFLREGEDGTSLTVADYEGEPYAPPDQRRGLAAMRDVPDVGLVAALDSIGDPVIQAAVMTHCNDPLLTRFGVLSAARNMSPDMVLPLGDTSRAAMYCPWLEVLDPLTQAPRLVSPVGHVAGALARVARQRGAHWSPENEPIQGILGTQRTLNERECAQLSDRRVVPIRDLSAVGGRIVLWGAHTLADVGPWQAIQARRLASAVERTMLAGTQWVLDHANTESLWADLSTQVSTFLGRLWHSGILQGNRPEDAFFLRCGRDTMTEEDIAAGRVICDVGLAVLRPREFATFRLTQSPLGPRIVEGLAGEYLAAESATAPLR